MNFLVTSLLIFFSSLLLAHGGAGEDLRRLQFPRGSKVFLENQEVETNVQNEVLERRRRIVSESVQGNASITVEKIVTVPVSMENMTTTQKTLAFEALDMENSSANRKDDDNIITTTIIVPSEIQNNADITIAAPTTAETILSINKKLNEEDKNLTKKPPPKIFPDNPDKIITDLPPEQQNKLNHYRLINDKSNSTELLNLQNPSDINKTSLTEESFLTVETREKMVKQKEELIVNNKIDNTGMPPGVVALISTIGFAMIAVVAYIGLMVWKRYQEYLHGHRELLVNDFDANDINNFEL